MPASVQTQKTDLDFQKHNFFGIYSLKVATFADYIPEKLCFLLLVFQKSCIIILRNIYDKPFEF